MLAGDACNRAGLPNYCFKYQMATEVYKFGTTQFVDIGSEARQLTRLPTLLLSRRMSQVRGVATAGVEASRWRWERCRWLGLRSITRPRLWPQSSSESESWLALGRRLGRWSLEPSPSLEVARFRAQPRRVRTCCTVGGRMNLKIWPHSDSHNSSPAETRGEAQCCSDWQGKLLHNLAGMLPRDAEQPPADPLPRAAYRMPCISPLALQYETRSH